MSPLVLALPRVPPPPGGADPTVETSEIARVRQEVTERFHAATAAGVDLDVRVAVGRPAAEILESASRLGADLIVMGTHGASGFEHFVVGSVAERVLRRATCPVLTVPPRAQVSSSLPFRRLLCAVDAADASRSALTYAWSLAQHCGGSVTLLHVLEWPWDESPAPHNDDLPRTQGAALAEYRRYREAQAMRWLEALVPTPPPALGDLSLRLAHGRPHARILGVAAEERSDLIVMGVGARRPLELAVFGSTVHGVVREATCPVLTVRR